MHSPMGPGFESQVPHICFAFFLQEIQRAPGVVAHHTPSSRYLPDGLQAKSDGLDGRPTMVPNQPVTWDCKGQTQACL